MPSPSQHPGALHQGSATHIHSRSWPKNALRTEELPKMRQPSKCHRSTPFWRATVSPISRPSIQLQSHRGYRRNRAGSFVQLQGKHTSTLGVSTKVIIQPSMRNGNGLKGFITGACKKLAPCLDTQILISDIRQFFCLSDRKIRVSEAYPENALSN